MKEKIKSILFGILIGLIAFPTLTLGGTFVVSLIQGKSVEETIQILAEQIDALIGRVEIIESKQAQQELWQKKEEVCGEYRTLLESTPRMTANEKYGKITDPLLGVDAFIEYAEKMLNSGEWDPNSQLYLNTKKDLETAKQQKDLLKQAKEKCEELTSQYNQLYGK